MPRWRFLLPPYYPRRGTVRIRFRGGVRISSGVRRHIFHRHTVRRIGRRLFQITRRDSHRRSRSHRRAFATTVRQRQVMACMADHDIWEIAVLHVRAERPRPSPMRRDPHTAHTAWSPCIASQSGISTYWRSCRSRYSDSCPGRRLTSSTLAASSATIRFRARRCEQSPIAEAISDIGPVQGREPSNCLNSNRYVRSSLGLLSSDAGA